MSCHSMDHFEWRKRRYYLSYLAAKKLQEKKNKAKPMWRSILEISIRTNTQTDYGVIELGRAKAAQLKRTNKEVSWNIPEWLAA